MTAFPSLTSLCLQILQGPVRDRSGVRNVFDQWFDNVAPDAEGWLNSTAGLSDDEFVALFTFASAEAVRRVEQRPDHQAWRQDLEQELADGLTVRSSENVAAFGDTRPDDAGFVVVAQGQTTGLGQALGRVTEHEQHHIREHHLPVLGGVIADHGEGWFTELIYFPSVQEAQADEAKEVPKEGLTMMERIGQPLTELRYLELHNPWLYHH